MQQINQSDNENIPIDFYPTTEQLINQQRVIVCRVQKEIIFNGEGLEKLSKEEDTTPTVMLWQEISSLKALTEIKQIEQPKKENSDSMEGDR
jgi:hypothetical protein